MNPASRQELVEVALSGVIPYELLVRIAELSFRRAPAVLDELAVYVAQKYASGEMSFEDADVIMNAAFSVAVSEEFWAEHDRTVPPAMYEVYQAFDAGEYSHPGDGESVVPELKYTRPLIERFLASGGSGA